MGRVQDRVAVVTGAGNGIGRAIALRLAEEGALLVCGDVDEVSLRRTVASITDSGGTALAVVGDLTQAGPAKALIETAVERFGRLEILVNNVGGGRPGRIWELTEETWDGVLTLNLRAMFLCTRAAAPQMMQQRYGKIVSISSGARGDALERLLRGRGAVFDGEGRRARLHPRRRAGAGRVRHQRQRRRAGTGRHRADRAGPPEDERDA